MRIQWRPFVSPKSSTFSTIDEKTLNSVKFPGPKACLRLPGDQYDNPQQLGL